ncbi:MAG TPA: phosphoribosyl-ATP diphosphatase [Alphaproteobacteria bacterium]|jgi:phosphoribosyl-ATP pyrophosphohydrolase|nr:phosphoribosyl-ATP diphosphatase [Alphaproteobacteria bacterium]HBC55218.1 phosphoribosyl-ATP diphosphatase [Alphaproteobacteria bacterium]
MADPQTDILAKLCETIAARVGADPASSYTAKLLAGAPLLPAKKLGEEAVETALAAMTGDAQAICAEAADLLYHLLVLLQASNVSLADVCTELARREGISGIEEKNSRAD